jgi:hypothetical protein
MDKVDVVKRVFQAACRIMYSKEGRAAFLSGINSDKPNEQKLALEVVGLMRMVYDKSNKTMPPGAIPAASALLVYEVADFMRQAGEKLTVSEVKNALIATMKLLRVAFSKEIESEKGAKPQPQAQPQTQPQAGGGLINQAMGA